mmetsp:Transcript_19628/g.65966  ORF Transcript_19628/g.65966 Transcript_19628/m.65966 type:complete len:268 (+) Transcript_19628:53-856(+)
MAKVGEANALFQQFKAKFDAPSSNADECAALLDKLKLCITDFSTIPPLRAAGAAADTKELLLVREVLEHGAFLSIRMRDIPSFERYVSQLKVYYNDFGSLLPESQHQYPILGLNLLRLLAQNRTAEFHTELELIPAELHQANVYIRYPTELEQHIMEGSFTKVLKARADGLYSKEGDYFMSMLTDTVREEIANCAEKAYGSMSLEHARETLMLGSTQELEAYAKEREWRVEGGMISFQTSEGAKLEVPSHKLIHETLLYAKELERIV